MQLSLLALALSTSLATPSLAQDGGLAPPGLVLVPGGRAQIGTSFKEVVKLIEEHREAEEKAGGFLAEYPDHKVKVADYFLMVNEVTNEQYKAFVEASGSKPPYYWGEEALAEATQEHARKQKELRDRAREEGRQPPPREPFDPAYWWDQNWEGATWEVPERDLKKPVVYVDYQDARRYAEWAGLRLPTEEEFEYAVRGTDGRAFPWGPEWKKGMASTKEDVRSSSALEVGSFADGASEQGVHDLVGNVWEWTQSPYNPYPGWKAKRFSIGRGSSKKEIDSIPKWSADWRVVKSGSQQTGWIFARASIRGGFERYQRAHVLGFRCAASTKPGLDFAEQALKRIPRDVRPRDKEGPIAFDPNQVVAMDRWSAGDGSAEIPGYAVIEGYDYVLFTPAEEMQVNGLNDIRKMAGKDQLAFLGFLATNQPLVEPELPAGTYLVALRGASKVAEREEEGAEGETEAEEPEAEPLVPEGEQATTFKVDEVLTFDLMKDHFILIDMEGNPVAALEAKQLDYGNPPAGAGNMAVVDRKVTLEKTGADGKIEKVVVTQQWLDIRSFVKGKSRKGLESTLSVRFAEGLFAEGWRR